MGLICITGIGGRGSFFAESAFVCKQSMFCASSATMEGEICSIRGQCILLHLNYLALYTFFCFYNQLRRVRVRLMLANSGTWTYLMLGIKGKSTLNPCQMEKLTA